MGIASDGGAESFVVSAKIAKTITEIARTHVAETGAKIKEVVEKTLEDVKEYFGDKVTDRDIMDVLAGKYNEKSKLDHQLWQRKAGCPDLSHGQKGYELEKFPLTLMDIPDTLRSVHLWKPAIGLSC